MNVVCRCRSYCTRYDPTTDTHVGPGLSIPFKTARHHALQDQQAEAFGNFVGNLGPPASEHVSPADTGTPDVEELSQEELSTLEAEIAGRTAWAPKDRSLVFFTEPGPSQKFNFPKPTELHLSNYGPHALDPTHHANTAYIENEMRLCEMLVHLHELGGLGAPLASLEGKVLEGLARMWKHKEAEWKRRRYRSIAIHNGIPVVDTGMYLFRDRTPQI